jgi:hypothetical protein
VSNVYVYDVSVIVDAVIANPEFDVGIAYNKKDYVTAFDKYKTAATKLF